MDRLHGFPQPFPDESLYSLAVRYHRLLSNDSYRRTSHELFGVYSRTCGSILPCCLGALSQRLASAYSVEQLIDRFTLLPLYEPFLNDTKSRAARIAMAGDDGTGLKMSLGITASGFLKHASFRYCERCVEEDIQHCGSTYWHRIHQATGTCICPLHGEVLCGTTFPNGADWRCMLFPAEVAGSPVMQVPCRPAAGELSEMQLWGLEHPAAVRNLLVGDFLWHRLDEMGFLKAGRVRLQTLKSFLTPRLLCSPRGNEFQELNCSWEWVLGVVRPRRTVVQPLKFYFLCWLLEAGLEHLKSFLPQADIYGGEATEGSNTGVPAEESEIEARRQAFSSSKNVKCHEKPGYQWLYRHDREWLTQYVSAHPFIRRMTGLVDWAARDEALARNLLIARDQILFTQGKPQKVTRAALNRRVAHSQDFLRMPDKFPISTLLMSDMLESDHDHQVRKVRWAVRQYLLPERSALSVVYRFAGIRLSHVTEEEVLDILSVAKELRLTSGSP
ncbi:TnsD family Tn7-like transposition protein [Pseudomonas fragi]|uniref:TnsD family Tn7-like transposition protein n=1 Tax=Pseudomonas fragi TaxID=296 RepID=A0ABT4WQG5_PSEFR|nr:TnsD family Tn7-like transposition protein [Pseudomonas fragi]MDA7022287.1 TnsD family Tn7-like transposition protein [Pseudomonas fragi]